jgi:hypothetical protein
VGLIVDGVHFAESCCGVALGIGTDGVKHPLALVERLHRERNLVFGSAASRGASASSTARRSVWDLSITTSIGRLTSRPRTPQPDQQLGDEPWPGPAMRLGLQRRVGVVGVGHPAAYC